MRSCKGEITGTLSLAVRPDGFSSQKNVEEEKPRVIWQRKVKEPLFTSGSKRGWWDEQLKVVKKGNKWEFRKAGNKGLAPARVHGSRGGRRGCGRENGTGLFVRGEVSPKNCPDSIRVRP